MEEEFKDLRRDVTAFLSSLRMAIDRRFRASSRSRSQSRELYLSSMLIVEEARLRFNAHTYLREDPAHDEWVEIRNDLLGFINTFIHSPDVNPAIFDMPFRVAPTSLRRDDPSPFISSLQEGGNVGDALIAFRRFLEQWENGTTFQTSMDFGDLANIVPGQQVAPARFEVIGGRIVLAHRPPETRVEDRSNIQAALDHIRTSGQSLIQSLEQSNCDRRLLDSVRELHSQIEADENVVKIGLANIACGVMSSQFHQELPDALNAMLSSYGASISMYVAQFPDWERFTKRAASIQLSEVEISEIDATAGEVIQALASQPDLADPEVPKTIQFVRELMARPGNTAKRAAFAMMRTIENLVSSIVRHSVSALSKTADKTVDQLSSAASKVIIGLLGIALLAATGIGPAAVHAGVPWVKQAAEVVQLQVNRLSGH